MKEQLQRIGVPVPERPEYVERAGHSCSDDANLYSDALNSHIDTLERLVAALAERVERAERCLECDGHGWNDALTCAHEEPRTERCERCSGTGRRQACRSATRCCAKPPDAKAATTHSSRSRTKRPPPPNSSSAEVRRLRRALWEVRNRADYGHSVRLVIEAALAPKRKRRAK